MEQEFDFSDLEAIHKKRLDDLRKLADDIVHLTPDDARAAPTSALLMHLNTPNLIMEIAGAINLVEPEEGRKFMMLMQNLGNDMQLALAELDGRLPPRKNVVQEA